MEDSNSNRKKAQKHSIQKTYSHKNKPLKVINLNFDIYNQLCK